MAATVRNTLSGLTRGLLNKPAFYPRVPKNVFTPGLFLHTSSVLDVKGQEIKMPSLSPTMTEGTLIKWLKKEGDTIAPGDVLCEIQTDKAVMSFETEEEGILAKILVTENTKDVKVGTQIALMVLEGEDWQAVEMPDNSESASSATRSSGLSSAASTGTVPGQSVSMPSLSPTMTEGTIIKWCKKEGDAVAPGDVLCEIQTDKAVMSFETEEEGILAKILVPDNTAGVQVGTLIALLVPEGENWQEVMIPSTTTESATAQHTTAAPEAVTSSKSQKTQNYGPAVRSLLELYQLDSTQIQSSGRNNKLIKSDVLNYISERKLQPKPPTPVPLPGRKSDEEFITTTPMTRPSSAKYVDIEISSMRKTIAKRLTESKVSIPHAYAMVDCHIDFLLSLRKQMKSAGINVSVNDFVVKAVALALRECPLVNCLYLNDQVTAAPSIDVSIAVATDSGLITPIVKNANVKSINEIASEVKELATRAKMGKLQLHEFQGGSFTISNLGMFGISEFSAIINPPQCGILAVGGGRNEINAKGQAVTRMTSTLSYDSRAISESAVADFLEMFQLLMENPANILVGSSPERAARVASR